MIPEELLLERIIQPVPVDAHVVPVSLPVTNFGDPNTARVATISINPSVVEFCTNTRGNPVLPAHKKRFVDRETLGIGEHDIPTLDQARQVLASNHNYFNNNPYGWFNQLQRWVLNPLNASYADASAVHLDLVQWATNPVWSGITNEDTKTRLITEDIGFLAQLLEHKTYDLLLLNGRTVHDTFTYHDLFTVEHTIELKRAGRTTTIWTGHAAGTPFICWSRFLQGPMRNVERQELSDWLADFTTV